MRDLSDYELMLLVKQKNRMALSILYDRYATLIYSFALKSMKEEFFAKDIVQKVFLRLWTTQSDFNPDKGKFTSWLLTITRNITIDEIRKKRRDHHKIIQFEPEKMVKLPDKTTLSPEYCCSKFIVGTNSDGLSASIRETNPFVGEFLLAGLHFERIGLQIQSTVGYDKKSAASDLEDITQTP